MKAISSILLSVLLLAPLVRAQEKPAAAQPAAPAQAQKPAEAKPVSLEEAYRREFAFLQGQKRELAKRIKTFEAQAASAEKALRGKISALEQKNIDLSAQEDRLRAELTESEQKDLTAIENDELLEMTFSQANASLANYGLSLAEKPEFENASKSEKVAQLFNQASQLLGGLGSIRAQEGKFFLTDGTEVSGKVVQLGNIAAYGVSEKGSGLLVPAGAGRFKLWSLPAADTAKALMQGQAPETLKIFLFESKDKPIDEKKEKTAISVIDSGGEIGWIIVGLGGLAAILVLMRIAILSFASRNTKNISAEVADLVEKGHETEAVAYCQQQSGPVTRVLKTVIDNSRHHHEHMDDVISEALLHEFGKINRYGSAILVIASISPLLGLLGTVTGMISTFDIITEFGTGDPKMLSGGISIALVTTQLGLIVAIPTVLAGTLLGSWAESIKYDLEEAALKISNILLERSGAAMAVGAAKSVEKTNTTTEPVFDQGLASHSVA